MPGLSDEDAAPVPSLYAWAGLTAELAKIPSLALHRTRPSRVYVTELAVKFPAGHPGRPSRRSVPCAVGLRRWRPLGASAARTRVPSRPSGRLSDDPCRTQ